MQQMHFYAMPNGFLRVVATISIIILQLSCFKFHCDTLALKSDNYNTVASCDLHTTYIKKYTCV